MSIDDIDGSVKGFILNDLGMTLMLGVLSLNSERTRRLLRGSAINKPCNAAQILQGVPLCDPSTVLSKAGYTCCMLIVQSTISQVLGKRCAYTLYIKCSCFYGLF